LAERLNNSPGKFHLFANFFVGREVDIAVVKNNAIFIVELKTINNSKDRKIKTSLNGSWERSDGFGYYSPIGENRPNYYGQVEGQFYSLVDYIYKKRNKFLNSRKVGQFDRNKIKNFIFPLIVINPEFNPAEESAEHPWIKVIGFNKLHQEIEINCCPYFELNEEEIISLAKDAVELKEKNLSYFYRPMIKPQDLDWEEYCRNLKNDLNDDDLIDIENYYNEEDKEKPNHRRKIVLDRNDLLNLGPKIILSGKGGSGKTTSLKQLATFHSKMFGKNPLKKDSIIPIYVPLRPYKQGNGGLWTLIQKSFAKYHLAIERDDLRSVFIMKTDFLLLFDGYDEISPKEIHDAQAELNDFIAEFPSIKSIIAVRESRSLHFIEGLKETILAPLGDEKQYELISIYASKCPGLDALHISDYIKKWPDLFRLPLYISLFVESRLEALSSNDMNEASLIVNSISRIIEREIERQSKEYVDIKGIERLYSRLAFKLIMNETNSISEQRFDVVLESEYSDLKKKGIISNALSDLRTILDSAPILKKEDGQISFEHYVFQEYLAAKEAAALLENNEINIADVSKNLSLVYISAYSMNFLLNPHSYLEKAEKAGSFIFISKCLAGKGGTEARTISEIIVKEMLRSEDVNRRSSAVRVIGEARNTYCGFSMLLNILTEEEKWLRIKYENYLKKCEESNQEIGLSVETILAEYGLSVNETKRIRKEDFRIYNEAATYLSRLRSEQINRELSKIIPDIDTYGISARGYAIEALCGLQFPELDEIILNFLYERFDKSRESSVQVRTAAYRNLVDDPYWEDKKEAIQLIEYIQKQQVASENWSGFPIDLWDYIEANALWDYEIGDKADEWLIEVIERLNFIEAIGDSEVNGVMQLLHLVEKSNEKPDSSQLSDMKSALDKFVVTRITPSESSLDSNILVKNRNSFRQTLDFVLTPAVSKFLDILIYFVSLAAMNGSLEAYKNVRNLSASNNPFLGLLGHLGIEILVNTYASKEIMIAYEKEKKEILNSLNLIVKNHGQNALCTLVYFLRQKNEFRLIIQNVDYSKSIKSLIAKVAFDESMEDAILELLSNHIFAEYRDILLDIIEMIGSRRTVTKLETQIVQLRIPPASLDRIKMINYLLKQRVATE
jgi:hypothetical protein